MAVFPQKDSSNLYIWKVMIRYELFAYTSLADQNIVIASQEDNQGRLKISNSASSLGSLNLSDKSFGGDETLLLLPRLKKHNFQVPKYVPINEWMQSQLFEVIHLVSAFVDLISARNKTLSKYLDDELDQIVQILDETGADFKIIFLRTFNVMSTLYNEEMSLWMELKLKAHINSLISQLVELCSQLPERDFYEISDKLKAKGSGIDLVVYKMALLRTESKTLSCE